MTALRSGGRCIRKPMIFWVLMKKVGEPENTNYEQYSV